MSCLLTCSIALQARTNYLRRKSRAALEQAGVKTEEEEKGVGSAGVFEHLNLFPLEESSEKKGNAEYLKEKKEETVTTSSHLPLFLHQILSVPA